MQDSAVAKDLNEGQGANRYKYQSFNARVSQLKIKITRQVGLKESATVATGSFFNDSLEEWKELNLSAPFVRFGMDVKNYCQTLPQLLYHKEQVVEVLIKTLNEGNVLALEPVLDLTTQLSKDLDTELYPYLERILAAILPLLDLRDVNVIEWAFNCIASLFKKYSEQLRTNLCPTFKLLAPLLGEDNAQKPYIRNFAAESFSYLIRKAPIDHLKVILAYILSHLRDTPTENFIEGIAKLLFETIKLVGNQFQHRGVDVVLRELIRALKQEQGMEATEKSMSENATFRTLCKILVLMVHYSTKEHFKGVCEMLLAELTSSVDMVATPENAQKRWLNIAESLALLNVIVSVRKGGRIDDFVKIYEKAIKVSTLALAPGSEAPALVVREMMKLSSSLLAYSPLENVLFPGGLLLESIYKHEVRILRIMNHSQSDVSTVLAFSISLINFKWTHYTQILLPHIVKYCATHWDAQNSCQIIVFLATLLTSDVLVLTPGMVAATVDENGLLKFPLAKTASSKKNPSKTEQERIVDGILRLLSEPCDWKSEADMLSNVSLEDEDNAAVPRIALVTAALSIVPHISLQSSTATDAIMKLFALLVNALSKEDQSITLQKRPFVQGSAMATLHILLGETIEILAVICERAGNTGAKLLASHWGAIVKGALYNYGSNEVVLRGVAKYCTVLKESNESKHLFSVDTLRDLYPRLEKNINSLQHRRRLHTLQILSSFEVIPFEDKDPQQKKLPQNDIFAQCLAIEDINVTVETYREKTMQIRRLHTIISSGRVNDFYKTVSMRLCLGILTINFQPLWADATALLVKSAELYPDAFWDLLFGEIKRFEDESLLVESGLSAQAISDYHDAQSRLGMRKAEPEAKKKGINFDCPNFKRIRQSNATATELMDPTKQRFALVMHFIKIYAPGADRLDYWNYYGLILKALTEVPQIAEMHNRHLVQVFLKFIKDEYEPVWNRKDERDLDEDDQEEDEVELVKILPKTAKDTRDRLHLYLALFAKFKNPKQAYESNTLHELYLRLLTIGDAPLQTLALNCIFTFKSPALVPYQDNLRNMLDDVKFRDELSTFIIAEGESSSIGSLHRDEVMPIVIRVLYGCMISRKGKGSAKAGMAARRKAVLTALGGCSMKELGFFFTLMLSPFDIGTAGVVGNKFVFAQDASADCGFVGPLRKQVGFLNILEDVLKMLGTTIAPFISQLMTAVLCMVNQAQKRLDLDMGDHAMLGAEEGMIETLQIKQLREVRQYGIKRITKIFSLPISTFDFEPYVPAMFESFLNRRVGRLDTESTQAPSAIMELFATWASRKEYVMFLVKYNTQVLEKLYSCLSAKKVRDPVISMVLEVCEDILGHCFEENLLDKKPLTTQVLIPYTDCLLDNLEIVLLKSSEDAKFGKDSFSKREISIISQIAMYVKNGPQAIKLVDLLLPSLKKNHRIVPERTKADILRIIVNFLPIIPDLAPESPLFVRYFNQLVILFSTLVARDCRVLLVDVMNEFAKVDPSLASVSSLVADLNSFSTTRIDVPDFDRRMDAFNLLTNSLYKDLNDRQWQPVLHNMMFYIRDPEEMSIRSNATFGLQRFIDQCADITAEDPRHEVFRNLLAHVVYPGLKKGFKSPIELIRFEFVAVLAHAVKRCPDQVQFSDMTVLLAGGDEEASFFTNIYHIQLHRRIRALNRFSEECAKGAFRPTTLTQIFAPLIAHFIFEADKATDHNLVNETVSTLGVIASQLPWGSYYALLKGYLKLIPRKSEMEKILVRTVIAILDNFHFDIKNVEVSVEDAVAIVRKKLRGSKPKSERKQSSGGDDERPEEAGSKSRKRDAEGDIDMEVAPMPEIAGVKTDESPATVEGEDEEPEQDEGGDDEGDEEQEEADDKTMEVDLSPEEAAAALAGRIHDTVIKKLLPELHRYLTNRDDTSVMIRVPVALAITKLLKALPDVSLRTNLPGLLTSVCQILKSRQQEARDTTRETLVKIAMFLGAGYFNFILKEMRGALLRGYQLHVLGFTLHAMLTHMIPTLQVGDLDYCLKEIVDVLVNDVFGETGIEKETEEITGKMKEAKSNLSYHSFELMAGIIEFKSMGLIMVPLKELLSESESVKVMRKIDEVMRRLATGLNNNPHFDTKETLIFCHGLISQNLALSKSKEEIKKEKSRMEINYTVNTKRPSQITMDCFPANAHRFVAFGLNIFKASLTRNKFDVRSPEQLALLDPFVEIVGNGVFAKYPDVIQQSLKIMCILAKLKLPSLDRGLPVVIKQTFVLLKVQGSTKSELAQSCFRMLAIAIRECKKIVVKEEQLTMLLTMIRPDLEEPERQTTTFSLIRAIVSRQFVVPEMYDMMESISEIMVTSQSQQAREECRRALLQFLLDYPQGRGRLRNQMNFFVKNLSYVFESGRQSVMEMMHVIIQKFADEVLMDYTEMFFLALVMQLVNDDSSKCREMAGALIKALFQRMNRAKLDNSFLLLAKWFDQTEQRTLQRAASQVYGLAIEAFGPAFKKQIPTLLPRLKFALESSLQIMEEAQEHAAEADKFEEQDQDAMDLDAEWEVGYYALNTFTKLVKQFPAVINSDEVTTLWPLIREHMLHPHAWVRLSATRLFGVFFSGIDPVTRSPQGNTSSELVLTPEMLKSVADKLCEQLKSEFLSKDLGGQIVKNLFFIAKCFYALPDEQEQDHEEEEEEEEEEGDEEEGDEQDGEATKAAPEAKLPVKRSLYWLVKRLSFLSRGAAMKNNNNKSVVQQTCIFQCMAAITTHIHTKDLKPYLVPIISPIYRLVNDETAKGTEIEELKKLGSEVLDLIQKRAGTTDYFVAYNKIRQHVLNVRRERRQKRVMQAMNDPEARARRRIQKNEMKSRKRQLKTKEFAKDKIRLTTIKKRRVD
ncbi:U3 snoRNP protein [Mortierella polycephala]|uniref:U3 snoRNP protein n=1 Tax=Mortierella polycephala TaxID=41804 RepID=A0A9P6U1R4_9FUNG|nr:U3 snoRNP protein [Mortierella polycephala]